MSELKEYVVTLHCREDLEEFYNDMEILRPTAYNCMPERVVDVAARRPLSRNTHYWMTDSEADTLRQDPRVLAVELTPKALGIVATPSWIQTSSHWSKSTAADSNQLNWGLLRTVEKQPRSNWGSDHITDQLGTVSISEEGRAVDIIVVDGHVNPAHPEFSVNTNGSGGSRVKQINWHSLTAVAESLDNDHVAALTTSYVYEPYTGNTAEEDNNHGAHVAGIIAGNTKGWARKSNIYNISPYSTDPNQMSELVLIDYIRAFHSTKSVNPATGRRNPTICNHSWGYSFYADLSSNTITSITFRGNQISGPFTEQQLKDYGIPVFSNSVSLPYSYPALNADIEDAIADGIIMVAAAGNNYTKIDIPGGVDYNNTVTFNNTVTTAYCRGSSPGNAPGVICVGAVDATSQERKAAYSNSGPRIDIWAPGSNIISAVNSSGTGDTRNSQYQIAKKSGTSMASPQVCGVLACVLETYPAMTAAQALEYIQCYSQANQLANTNSSLSNYQSLHGAANLYLAYNKERPTEGAVFPKTNYKTRPASGLTYPRVRKY